MQVNADHHLNNGVLRVTKKRICTDTIRCVKAAEDLKPLVFMFMCFARDERDTTQTSFSKVQLARGGHRSNNLNILKISIKAATECFCQDNNEYINNNGFSK